MARAGQNELPADVEVFLRRAAPHFMAGKSVEDSLRAVLDDDARLFTSLYDRRTSHFFPTPDERGRSHATSEGKGDLIASELSRTVYGRFRAARLEALIADAPEVERV